MFLEKTSLSSKLLVCAGLVVYLYLCAQAMNDASQFDFCVYRTGSQLALEGLPPYVTPILRSRVADQFPPENEDSPANQCGFFLPPQAIAVFLPFAKASWPGVGAMWFFFLTLMGMSAGALAYTFGRSPERRGYGWAFVVIVVLINPITFPVMVVGQTGLLFVGCFTMGQLAFENGSPRFGTFLWSIPFIKPQLALPFLVLAWVLGGWRRVVGIAVVVAVWNLFGGLILTGNFEDSFNLLRVYMDYIGAAHKTVKYNLVAENYQITSWNRIIAACGGPAIDLKIWMILTGFALWGLLIFGRMRIKGAIDRERLDQAYLLAATVVASLFFAQVLAYELILLALLAPLILQHFDANRRYDAYALIAILLFTIIPMEVLDRIAERIGWEETSRQRTLMRSHRCFGMAMLAAYLFIRGPANSNSAATNPSMPVD